MRTTMIWHMAKWMSGMLARGLAATGRRRPALRRVVGTEPTGMIGIDCGGDPPVAVVLAPANGRAELRLAVDEGTLAQERLLRWRASPSYAHILMSCPEFGEALLRRRDDCFAWERLHRAALTW